MNGIRWIIKSDLAEVAAIERQSFESPWSEDEFLTALRLSWVIGLVALVDGRIDGRVAGFAIYSLERSNEIDLLNIAVHPDYRRQGIGRSLIDRLKGKLAPKRRERITLLVRERNLPGQVFFRQCGFQCIATLKNQWTTCPDDAYFMEYQERRQRSELEVNRVKGKVI